MDRQSKGEVAAEREIEITGPRTLEFQIAVAPHPNTEVSERLSIVLDGKPVQALEISGTHGNRIHKFDVPVGYLTVDYAATIVCRTAPAPVTEHDLSMYLRPSRYAEADKLYGFAATEFGSYVDSTSLLERVSLWVGTRLNYVPGSSDTIDGAGGQGAGPRGVGLRARPVSDGFPRGRRGVRRREMAGYRRNLAGAAAVA